MATKLLAKPLRAKMIKSISQNIKNLPLIPTLTVIQIGTNSASKIYIKSKVKLAHQLGLNITIKEFPDSITQAKLLSYIDSLNSDGNIDAIMVQLPLPKKFDTYKVINKINPEKDIDGLTDINLGHLYTNSPLFYPKSNTALGIMKLLDYYDIKLEGQTVVIIGRSKLVGKPLAAMMTNHNATVIQCHSYTNNLVSLCRDEANIIVSATGKPNTVIESMTNDTQVLVDAGITRISPHHIVGDMEVNNNKNLTMGSAYTPVPGGVGPMTVVTLMEQLVNVVKNKFK